MDVGTEAGDGDDVFLVGMKRRARRGRDEGTGGERAASAGFRVRAALGVDADDGEEGVGDDGEHGGVRGGPSHAPRGGAGDIGDIREIGRSDGPETREVAAGRVPAGVEGGWEAPDGDTAA